MATKLGRRGKRIAAWWDGISPQWRSFLTWLLPLLFAHVLVALAYWFNETHGQSLARDHWTLRFTGGTEAASVAVMLVGTRKWSAVPLGLTLVFSANAPVLLRLLGQVGPTPTPNELNLLRSYYQVGTPILFVGLCAWAFGSKFGTRHGPLPAKADPIALGRENAVLRQENAALRAACGEQGVVVA